MAAEDLLREGKADVEVRRTGQAYTFGTQAARRDAAAEYLFIGR